MKAKTNRFLSFIVILLALGITSCEKNVEESEPLSASIRFVNSVEGIAAQDIYVNNSKVNTSAIVYGASTGKIEVPVGDQTINFKNTGTTTVSAQSTIFATANTTQTAFLIKQTSGSLTINNYLDDTTIASGMARVRFVNVAPLLTGAINISTTTGTSILAGIGFKTASAYQTLNPGIAFNVNMAGSQEITTIAASEFKAGKIYTVWFDSSSATKINYHVITEI